MATVAADEMIEVMARAVKAQWDTEMMKQAEESNGILDYEPGEPGDWQEFVPEARAALSAILPVLREEVAERMDNARASYRAASIPSVGKGRQEARDYKTMAIAFAHAGVEIRARFDQIAKEIEG